MKRFVALSCLAFGCNAQAPLDPLGQTAESRDAGTLHDDATDATDAGGPASFAFGGDVGPYYDQINDNYDAILASTVDYANFLCVCEAGASSGPDFDSCVTDFVSPTPPPLLACTKVVYSRSERTMNAISCERQSVDQYMACILESTCLDFGHITDCEIDRILRQQDCENIPYAVVVEDQELCYGRELPAAFVCDDGNSINPDWVCDFEADCDDGSDEVGCDPHAGLNLGP